MRVKLEMQSNNTALRDPVAFRCNLTHHWRTGHTYKVRRGLLCSFLTMAVLSQCAALALRSVLLPRSCMPVSMPVC